MTFKGNTHPLDMTATAASILGFSSATSHRLSVLASEALHQPTAPVVTGSDEHVRILDRVARARCVEWLDHEHGMDPGFAREIVDRVLDLYADSTRVRR